MAKPRGNGVGAGRTKEARNLIKAVEKAGGTVRLSGNNHLKIRGPKGQATVASKMQGRIKRATLLQVARYTGLTLGNS